MYLKTMELQRIDNQNNKTMKTKVFSLIAIAALAFGTVNLSKAADGRNGNNTEVSTTLNDVSKISKIEVRGNVEVFVSDGSTEKVKVYNRYYAENAMVQNENGVLKISSYGNEKLVVWVTANDLHNITAYDNAQVKSFGKLSEIGLDVNLYDNSTADLDLDSYSASFSINDKAKANLSGFVNECELSYANTTTVNQSQLSAEHMTESKKGADKPAQQDLAIL
jgi:hypothetical protein